MKSVNLLPFPPKYLQPAQAKYLIVAPIIACMSLIAGCGSDSSDSEKKYRGYMPKFAVDIIKSSPARPVLNVLSLESQEADSGSEPSHTLSFNHRALVSHQLSASIQPVKTQSAEQQNAQQPGEDSSKEQGIDFEAIDCSRATDLWNAAPQAADFNSSAFDFIRNLQAQTVFYDCVIRAQVFNHSATVTESGDISTVTAAFNSGDNSYFASWNLPSASLTASNNTELQIDSLGILVNLQPGIDNTKTRVDLNQALVNNQFSKRIRSTLQDRLTNHTNIRSVTVTEQRNPAGELQQQNILGRIIFSNKLSVLAAAVKPGVGAVSYLKQCETSPAGLADDYLRECPAAWQELVYNDQWQIINDVNSKAAIKNKLNIASDSISAGVASIGAEQKFYNGESESGFFQKRQLPAAER